MDWMLLRIFFWWPANITPTRMMSLKRNFGQFPLNIYHKRNPSRSSRHLVFWRMISMSGMGSFRIWSELQSRSESPQSLFCSFVCLLPTACVQIVKPLEANLILAYTECNWVTGLPCPVLGTYDIVLILGNMFWLGFKYRLTCLLMIQYIRFKVERTKVMFPLSYDALEFICFFNSKGLIWIPVGIIHIL